MPSHLLNAAGSIVIDGQDLLQIAGKWKQTGDGESESGTTLTNLTIPGSGGSPFTSFKQIHESERLCFSLT
jgi:hypothetical protein